MKVYRDLRQIPLSKLPTAKGDVIVTMSEGQWDLLLSTAYKRGCVLLELDSNERPVRAYQKAKEGK